MEDHNLAPFLQLSCVMALPHATGDQYVQNTFHPLYMPQGNNLGLK